MTTRTVTIESLIAEYAVDIAFAVEEQPATTAEAFVDQLQTAAHNLGHFAGIPGADDLDDAATYLTDAIAATGKEQQVLLNRAAKRLADTGDMVDEYRLMV